MEKQKVLFGIIASIVCLLLMISGCTQQNTPSNQTNPPSNNSQQQHQQLQQILAKAESIESVYYELNISTTIPGAPNQNITMKIWQKVPYLKEEVSSTIGNITTNFTVIRRPGGIYRYNTTQNKYELDPGSFLPQFFIQSTTKDLLNNQTITTLGTETVNGLTATIIQYTPNQNGTSTTIKMWIWNEKGIPLKALYTRVIEQTNITMDYEYNKFSFSDIPDSTFSVE